MLFAFMFGLAIGLFFSPIALVPIGGLFLVTAVGAWAYGGDLNFGKILISVGYILALNAGFLVGAVIKRIHRNFRNRLTIAL